MQDTMATMRHPSISSVVALLCEIRGRGQPLARFTAGGKRSSIMPDPRPTGEDDAATPFCKTPLSPCHCCASSDAHPPLSPPLLSR
jgi:hypothetical protein